MTKTIVKSLSARNSKKIHYIRGRSKYLYGTLDMDNYYTKDETYNKEEVDEKISSGGGLDPDKYYTKDQTDLLLEDYVKVEDEITVAEVDNYWYK